MTDDNVKNINGEEFIDNTEDKNTLIDDENVEKEQEHREPSLEDQIADMKDKWIRSVAECENIKKRAQKEKEDTLKYATTNFAKDMIAITDYIEQALTSMKQDDLEDEKLKSFYAGIEMTAKELHNAFSRHGIKKIDPENRQFDPHLHQAVVQVESKDYATGEIVDVMQHGYTIHDRLLRPSMVSVCKKEA